MKALVVFGTRPEAIKMASVLNARLEERRAPYQPDFRMAVPDSTPTTLYRNQVNSAIKSKLARFLMMDRIRAEQAAAKTDKT